MSINKGRVRVGYVFYCILGKGKVVVVLYLFWVGNFIAFLDDIRCIYGSMVVDLIVFLVDRWVGVFSLFFSMFWCGGYNFLRVFCLLWVWERDIDLFFFDWDFVFFILYWIL